MYFVGALLTILVSLVLDKSGRCSCINVALSNIMLTEGGFIHSQQIIMEIFIKLFVN